MTVTETDDTTEDYLVQVTITDPETDAELVFSAETEDELEEKIEAYFDPFHEDNNGDSVV